jgi:hypothetical protein
MCVMRVCVCVCVCVCGCITCRWTSSTYKGRHFGPLSRELDKVGSEDRYMCIHVYMHMHVNCTLYGVKYTYKYIYMYMQSYLTYDALSGDDGRPGSRCSPDAVGHVEQWTMSFCST